ncbi:MAG: DUF1592 domain-containing protein [Pirellulaceae bacterium]|nr:DUF1592 domain-containing protein [Pirellulaceae bacterium]
MLRKYCGDCHDKGNAVGGIQFEKLIDEPDLANQFRSWVKIIQALQTKNMPPKDEEQPTDSERSRVALLLQTQLDKHIRDYEGDPGKSVLRRLTSAEYAYTTLDLTGVDLGSDSNFVNDAVGGEGFTNVGTAQFIDDVSLERHLEAAKRVAVHAVVGAGPLSFFSAAGETGRELFAIGRIADIYRQHGFRTGAGEGAEPFGLDLYPRALYVAWCFDNRQALGRHAVTLEELAQEESISLRFCQHIWRVLHVPEPRFPLSLIVDQWRALPRGVAGGAEEQTQLLAAVRKGCHQISQTLREWQSMLADAAGNEEETAVLTDGVRDVRTRQTLKADINWAKDADIAQLEISVGPASSQSSAGAITIWREPRILFRNLEGRRGEFTALSKHLTVQSRNKLAFSQHPRGLKIGEHDFVLEGQSSVIVELAVPKGARAAQFEVSVELDLMDGENRIVRCRLSDGQIEGETAAETGATSTLLADPQSQLVQQWRDDVAQFAQLLPEVSHREPAPSDRDPIPILFDNTYNKPERNHFHTAVKYHRDDRFLVEHMLDDATRAQLDEAWTDLLTAFDYHAQLVQFASKKYGVTADMAARLAQAQYEPARLASADIDQLSEPLKSIVASMAQEAQMMQGRLQAVPSRHVDEVIRFASLAWRRPLTSTEDKRLRDFYTSMRSQAQATHDSAIRHLITRVLIAPDFIYRVETSETEAGEPITIASGPLTRLSDRELANRLSYFLWSSMPDAELYQLAEQNRLHDSEILGAQVRRMLNDAKARRLATEFFGQWFGFYRFDAYRGIDAERFPEFTESLQRAMYDEAISFFTHIVRQNRPIQEILFADYTFVNAELAAHYGLVRSGLSTSNATQVVGLAAEHRGGLLGLGAIHAVTSAPLRTSAVKRGDWMLRRVVGSPVPPPPADAGSIAADDVQADGMTVRKRLEAHRTNVACQTCHSRIDPLGFAMEHFDPIGRWRDSYRDGLPIDAAGVLFDGTEIKGMAGLADFLRREQRQFERNLSSKLLGYALGRAELASDGPLIDKMLQQADSDGRFVELVICLVNSRQFQYRRK